MVEAARSCWNQNDFTTIEIYFTTHNFLFYNNCVKYISYLESES